MYLLSGLCPIAIGIKPTFTHHNDDGYGIFTLCQAQCRPLIEASARGYTKLVRLLLQHKANTDITDQVSLRMNLLNSTVNRTLIG